MTTADALTLAATIAALVGVVVMLFVIRKDYRKARATPAQRTWLKQHGGRFGMFPPMREPLGRGLLAVSAVAIVAMIASLFVGTPPAASAWILVGVGANLWNNHRNLNWIHSQPEYQELERAKRLA